MPRWFTPSTASLQPISRYRPTRALRLRIINGCQRAIIALTIPDLDVRVMAIDGQPAEPFSGAQRAITHCTGVAH